MNNKPLFFEDKMKYRDNEFLYDKCIKQHDCIKNYQWKMRKYKDIINKAIEYIDYMFDKANENDIIDDLLKIEKILKGSEE